MAETLLGVISKRLDDNEDRYKDQLTGAGAKDFAEYRYLCGVLKGISLAQEQVRKLEEQQYRDADDE